MKQRINNTAAVIMSKEECEILEKIPVPTLHEGDPCPFCAIKCGEHQAPRLINEKHSIDIEYAQHVQIIEISCLRCHRKISQSCYL